MLKKLQNSKKELLGGVDYEFFNDLLINHIHEVGCAL